MSLKERSKSHQAIKLPIRKYQTTAAVVAGIGFLFGILIPAFGFSTGHWACPFGSGLIRTGAFVVLTGILSATLIGNLVVLLLIFNDEFKVSKQWSKRSNRLCSQTCYQSTQSQRSGTNNNDPNHHPSGGWEAGNYSTPSTIVCGTNANFWRRAVLETELIEVG